MFYIDRCFWRRQDPKKRWTWYLSVRPPRGQQGPCILASFIIHTPRHFRRFKELLFSHDIDLHRSSCPIRLFLQISHICIHSQIDIAEYVGASLDVMQRDAAKMRDGGPTIFTSVKQGTGVDQVIQLILRGWSEASGEGVRPLK